MSISDQAVLNGIQRFPHPDPEAIGRLKSGEYLAIAREFINPFNQRYVNKDNPWFQGHMGIQRSLTPLAYQYVSYFEKIKHCPLTEQLSITLCKVHSLFVGHFEAALEKHCPWHPRVFLRKYKMTIDLCKSLIRENFSEAQISEQDPTIFLELPAHLLWYLHEDPSFPLPEFIFELREQIRNLLNREAAVSLGYQISRAPYANTYNAILEQALKP